MSFFGKIDFCPKKHLEVVLSTSNAKKWIFWAIWHSFCPEIFFHRAFSFCCRRPWKLLFLAYFSIFEKKKLKITKITKFQMSLERPIFNIFLHLKRRWKASKSYYSNSEKKKFFKRLQNLSWKINDPKIKNAIFWKNRFLPKKASRSCFFNF